MKILLICAGGLSTGVFVKKLRDYWKDKKPDWQIEAAGLPDFSREKMEDYDLLMVSPHLAYKIKEFSKEAQKPVKVVSANDYALGHCEHITEQIEDVLSDKDSME